MKLWRLTVFIVVFIILLMFIVLNLENKCDIRFGSEKMVLKDVPVFVTVFFSFIVGLLSAFPFVLGFRLRKRANEGKGLLEKASGKKAEDSGIKPAARTKGRSSPPAQTDPDIIDKTHYGID